MTWHRCQDCFETIGQRVAHPRRLGDVKSLEGLVEHQDVGFGVVEDSLEGEAAGFAAGKRAGLAVGEGGKNWRCHMVEPGVLPHRRLREERSRRAVEPQPLPGAFPGGLGRHVLAEQFDCASRSGHETGDRFEQGRFTPAVRRFEDGDVTLFEQEGNRLRDDRARAAVDLVVADSQHRPRVRPPRGNHQVRPTRQV